MWACVRNAANGSSTGIVSNTAGKTPPGGIEPGHPAGVFTPNRLEMWVRRDAPDALANPQVMHAALATADEYGTWFPRHPISNWAQYDMIHLVTKFGLLDLVFAPEGSDDGFNELIRESQKIQIGKQVVRVISVDTWERLKTATKNTN